MFVVLGWEWAYMSGDHADGERDHKGCPYGSLPGMGRGRADVSGGIWESWSHR